MFHAYGLAKHRPRLNTCFCIIGFQKKTFSSNLMVDSSSWDLCFSLDDLGADLIQFERANEQFGCMGDHVWSPGLKLSTVSPLCRCLCLLRCLRNLGDLSFCQILSPLVSDKFYSICCGILSMTLFYVSAKSKQFPEECLSDTTLLLKILTRSSLWNQE